MRRADVLDARDEKSRYGGAGAGGRREGKGPAGGCVLSGMGATRFDRVATDYAPRTYTAPPDGSSIASEYEIAKRILFHVSDESVEIAAECGELE
jgi:hypothetical protein